MQYKLPNRVKSCNWIFTYNMMFSHSFTCEPKCYGRIYTCLIYEMAYGKWIQIATRNLKSYATLLATCSFEMVSIDKCEKNMHGCTINWNLSYHGRTKMLKKMKFAIPSVCHVECFKQNEKKSYSVRQLAPNQVLQTYESLWFLAIIFNSNLSLLLCSDRVQFEQVWS